MTYLHSLFSGQWKIGCRNFFSQKIKVHVPYVHNFLDHLLGKNIEIEIWQISLNSEGLLMIMAQARVLDEKYWTSLILTLMKKWHFQQLYIRCVSQSSQLMRHQCSELIESWKNMKLNFQIYLPSRDHPDKLFFNYLHKFFGIIWWFFKVW